VIEWPQSSVSLGSDSKDACFEARKSGKPGTTMPTWTLSEGAANESAATLDSSSTLLPTHEDLPLSNTGTARRATRLGTDLSRAPGDASPTRRVTAGTCRDTPCRVSLEAVPVERRGAGGLSTESDFAYRSGGQEALPLVCSGMLVDASGGTQ
jgi:hypothetical protein